MSSAGEALPGTSSVSPGTTAAMRSSVLVALTAALAGCAQPNEGGVAWGGLTDPSPDGSSSGDPQATGPASAGATGEPSTSGPATSSATTSGSPGTSGVAGSSSGASAESSGGGPPLPDPGPAIGSFQLTYYWLAAEADHGGSATETLYDPDCNALATVSPAFADALTLEGTGRLTDGRVLNYWNTCGCPNSPCFFEVDEDHPWGYGVQNRALQPFRSLAVDTDVLGIGDWVYIAELDGITMPGEEGFVHDGCMVADDIGGGINGQHIDFFVGLREHYLGLDGSLGLTHVTVHAPGDRCGD